MDEQQILKSITPEINSLIRHSITGLAGALALHGVAVSQDLQSQLVQCGVSVVLFGATYAWSCLQKKFQKQQVVAALNTPVPVKGS